MNKVAFLGLGTMGAPMARHLSKARHEVVVFNRTASKALAWVALNGGRAAPTPGEAAEEADVVALCVGNDDDVREVTIGPHGAIAGMRSGAILVDHTTASAGLARGVGGSVCRARDRLRRRARVGRAGRCGERPAHDHVRQRRPRSVRCGEARARHLCQVVRAARPGRFGSAHQDGQPDLHRRARAGARRGCQLRGSGPASTSIR